MKAHADDSVRTGEVKGLVAEIMQDARNSGSRSHRSLSVVARKSARHSGIVLFDVSLDGELLVRGTGSAGLAMFLFGYLLQGTETIHGK